MTTALTAPFFEIGPKNRLRRAELETLARAAGRAGAEFGVGVVLTVPTALVAPVAELYSGVHVFAQGMHPDLPGDSVDRVTAESLVDAGAAGVMLNHDSSPLDETALAVAVRRAGSVGLQTLVCAATEAEALRYAALRPTAVLLEPPALIGSAGDAERAWVGPATDALHAAAPGVLAMHAGGVAAPAVARAVMAAGADATGSTSGVLSAADPLAAARSFVAAVRRGWDDAHARTPRPPVRTTS